ELEAENIRLKADLEALQTGQIMKLSEQALAQRAALIAKSKARREVRRTEETVPDQKTQEEYERRIAAIKAKLVREKSKVAAFMSNGRTVLDHDDRKAILICL